MEALVASLMQLLFLQIKILLFSESGGLGHQSIKVKRARNSNFIWRSVREMVTRPFHFLYYLFLFLLEILLVYMDFLNISLMSIMYLVIFIPPLFSYLTLIPFIPLSSPTNTSNAFMSSMLLPPWPSRSQSHCLQNHE